MTSLAGLLVLQMALNELYYLLCRVFLPLDFCTVFVTPQKLRPIEDSRHHTFECIFIVSSHFSSFSHPSHADERQFRHIGCSLSTFSRVE
jgi:hypothetical protein